MGPLYEQPKMTWEEQGERPLTPIHEARIDDKTVWDGSSFASKDDYSFYLTPRHVSALEDILHRVGDTPADQIKPEDCRHPALDADFSAILDEVQTGRGMVLVRNMPVSDKYSQEEIQKMYWAFCTHMGRPLSGSSIGQKIFTIRQRPGGTVQGDSKIDGRGGTEGQELTLHIDPSDLFTLLCVNQAKEGGESLLCSITAIHNDILEKSPHVLPILYRGFPYHRRSLQTADRASITPYNVPVFQNINGKLSAGMYALGSVFSSYQILGRAFTDLETEALDVLHETSERLQVEFLYEPGDMAVVNNFAMMHARKGFAEWDDASKHRLLYRIWMEADRDPWPFIPEIRVGQNVGWRGGVDPVPGKVGDAYILPDDIRELVKKGQTFHPRKKADATVS